MFTATVVSTPATTVTLEEAGLKTTAPVTAEAGTTDNRPKPIAATVASATRLKVVFVDICFLSISQDQEFPALGLGNIWPLICHERAFLGSYAQADQSIHRNLRCN
jgi:hypothetical protein